MARITIKQLQQQIVTLKSINNFQSAQITKLNKEIDSLRDKIKELQRLIDSSEIKLNKKNVGRKAYSNKKVIEKIYILYLQGKSLQGIVNELNHLKIKTNRGKNWSKSSIRFILLNSKNVTNRFIEEDTFNRTIKLLNENKK